MAGKGSVWAVYAMAGMLCGMQPVYNKPVGQTANDIWQ